MLERSHLMVVREIERQGSLTAAADVLNITQSALSHTVKKLEQQLGTPLWTREGRSMRLTQAGQYLLGLEARGQLPRPREPLHARVGYHQPCHLRALDVGNPGLELLRNVLELDVEFIKQ